MRRPTRLLATLATGMAVATAPVPALALDEAAGGTIDRSMADTLEPAFEIWRGFVDITILRPFGTARLLTGAFVGLPFATVINALAWPIDRDENGTVFKEDWDRYVVEPWEYTFEREVGEDLAGV